MQHAKQAELNVEPDQLTLTVAGKYHLQLPFPHTISAAEGTANFNSSKQQLEVVLPVVPPPPSADTSTMAESITQQRQRQQAKLDAQSQDRGVNDAQEATESRHDSKLAATSSPCAVPAPEEAADQLPSISHSQQGRSQDRDAAARQDSEAPATEPLTENQRKWGQLHPKASRSNDDDSMQASASQAVLPADTHTLGAAVAKGRCGSCTATNPWCNDSILSKHFVRCLTLLPGLLHRQAFFTRHLHASLQAVHSSAVWHAMPRRHSVHAGDTFIASPAFGGQLPGYVFTSRDQGLGYYKDAKMAEKSYTHIASASNTLQETPESTALPFVLKPRLRTRAAAEELD